MFVCICNAITDRQVGEALSRGVGCARDIYAFHGCRPQCGRCVPQMRALFSEQGRHCAAAPTHPVAAINPAFT